MSVVIIVHNLEAFIGQAINSVLNQTRPADEVIVVDDCSTDQSAERAKAYGSKVRYVRMPKNSGALLAALQGVKIASGDIVCMLDGDDYWETNKLSVVEREFTADPDLLLLSHDHIRVDEKGVELPIRDDTHENIASILSREDAAGSLSDLLREAVLNQTGYWLGSAYSFRLSLFDAVKFEKQISTFGFDRLKQTYLDLVVAPFLVLTNSGKAVGYAPDTRLFYRIHGGGSMAGNATPEQALKSVRKGRYVNELIALMLRENGASANHIRRREMILQEYDFLSALYSGEFATAARLYLRLARSHWRSRKLKKETLRFLAVRLFGPKKFLRLKRSAP